MISKVILTNIKSYLYAEFDFAPGFNVIGGETDEGKSNAFRAIRWACYNEPLGWNPKPWPSLKPKGKTSTVEVQFTDGNIVKRVRTFSGKNWYELNGEELAGLHGKVPDQIAAVVNMNHINIQHQKDMFFMLDETGGKAAKEVNKIADLEKMDVALKTAESFARGVENNIKAVGNNIGSTAKQIEELSWLEEVQPAFDRLERKEQNICAVRDHVSKVAGLHNNYVTSLYKLEASGPAELYEDFNGLKHDMGIIQKAFRKLKQIKDEYATAAYTAKVLGEMMPDPEAKLRLLRSYRQRVDDYEQGLLHVHNARQTVQAYQQAFKNLQQVLPNECTVKLGTMVHDLEELNKKRLKLDGLRSIAKDARELEQEIKDYDMKIHSDNDALQTLRGQIIVCPVCRREL